MNSGYKIRLNEVKLMHETMLFMNNEYAYMNWIYKMPDYPSEEDFVWFAEDEERYMELYVYFIKLMNKYKKDGLYKPSDSIVDFVHKLGIEIEILK